MMKSNPTMTGTLYIDFRGLLPPDGILPGAKFTLRPSLAFSYIGSVTAWHFSSRRQPHFAAWYMEWNYGTFAKGATYIRLGGIGSAHILVLVCFFPHLVFFHFLPVLFVFGCVRLGFFSTKPREWLGRIISEITYFVLSRA